MAVNANVFIKEKEIMEKKPTPRAIALLPVAVFLVLYLVLGIILEYVLKIKMGFYQIPIVVAFLVALLVACLQNRGVSFDEKLELMGQGIGDKNIVTMILIFLVAGIFVGVTGRSSAEAVAYFLLSIAPVKLAVAVLFVVACFVSMAMGTSVGTITLLAPIAVAVSADSGFDLPLCIASVMGGAMFGDNLSFISDTTIAACSTQGTEMKDKFRANFKIALPAALAALVLIIVVSLGTDVQSAVSGGHDLVLIIPYVLVLIGGIIGLNVFVVLLVGIAAGAAITLITGQVTALELMGNMGGGVSDMFETILVTLLVASLCGLIRAYGGFESILAFIRRVFRGKRGGQLGIGLLVGLMDIATANNTVASSWQAPLPRRWRRNTASAPSAPPPCWTPSPASFRVSSPTAPRCWWPSPPAPPSATPSAPLTSSPCCSTPSCCACPACCSSCSTRNKASHFVYLQQEPTFSRRWALGAMLPSGTCMRSAVAAVRRNRCIQNRLLPRDTASGAASAPALTLPAPPLGSSYSSFRCSSIQCRISLSRLMRLEGFPSRLRPWFSP